MKLIFLLLLGCLLGFGLGRLTNSPKKNEERENSALRSSATNQPHTPAGKGGYHLQELLKLENEQFRKLASNDAESALELVLQRRLTPESRSMIAGLLAQIGVGNPKLAEQYIDRIKSPREQKLVLEELIAIWAEEDTSAAKDFLRVQRPGFNRTEMIQTLVDRLLETDPVQAMNWVYQDLFGQERTLATRNAFETLADLNPEQAAKQLQDIQPGLLRNQNMDTVARRLAAQDIDQAFDWLRLQAEGPQKDRTYRTLMETFAAHDPIAAAQALDSLTDPKLRERLTTTVTQKLAETNPQAALEFSNRLPEDDSRLDLRADIVGQWAAQDWKAAFDFASKRPDPREYELLTAQAIFVGAEGDPIAAAELVAQLPPGHNVGELTQSISHAYAAKDLPKALDWARGLDDENNRDFAIASLVQYTSETNAPLAFELANEINDSATRAGMLEASLINLLQVDQEAGLRALNHPSVTPEMARRAEATLPPE